MKHITGILALALAALTLVACANTPAPVVTDENTTAATTIDVPSTTEVPATTDTPETTAAPATTEAPVTTAAPATTEAPATTVVPVTTAAPSTTAAPVTTKAPETTAAPVTTEAPVTTTAPITTQAPETTAPETPPEESEEERRQKELHAEIEKLLYKGDDGYIHITGSENIRIPATGVYLEFDDVLTGSYFASTELKMTAPGPDVPAYYGTDSPHSYYFEDNHLCISYNFGETVFRLPADVSESLFQNYYITEHVSWFVFGSPLYGETLYTVWNKGARVNVSVPPDRWHNSVGRYFCYLSDTVGFGLTGTMPAAGTRQIDTLVTEDGGTVFSQLIPGYVSVYNANNESAVRTGNEVIRFGDRVYFTGRYLMMGGRKHIEQLIADKGLSLTVMEIVLPDEEELLSGLYNYGKKCGLPYFDGDIGVVAYLINDRRDAGNTKQYYRYYISTDAGENWVPFDPNIPEDERTNVVLTYTKIPEPR